jgi:hypothetical protein
MFELPPLPSRLKKDTKFSLDLLMKAYDSRLGIVPFVGAGISRQFGLPTWREFLMVRAGELGSDQEARTTEYLAEGKFEAAAAELASGFRLNAFQKTLRVEFGDLALRNCDDFQRKLSSGAAGLIPFITKGPVITTNFDHVTEEIFKQRGRPFRHRLFPNQHGLSIDAFRNNAACPSQTAWRR